jgi:glutamate-5-semialdehyde dehydrogenase
MMKCCRAHHQNPVALRYQTQRKFRVNIIDKKILELRPFTSPTIDEYASENLSGNNIDIANGQAESMTDSLQDRLRLNHERIAAIAEAALKIVSLPDPIGDVIRGMSLPNALKLTQIRVPLGLIGVIYEARPNVTIDIAVLAIKSGNAVVLRGGRAAENTNRVLVQLLQDALAISGIDSDAVQTVDEFGRDGGTVMMQAIGLIDVLIPRGGAGLIQQVVH